MNDRFQFRVFDKDKNEYVEKGYIHRWGYLVMPTMKNDYSLAEAEGNFVIEQCTGLKDKNGKLIYEGDIVSYKVPSGKYNGVVRWDKNTGGWLKSTGGDALHTYIKTVEVIGNIHENKELLK